MVMVGVWFFSILAGAVIGFVRPLKEERDRRAWEEQVRKAEARRRLEEMQEAELRSVKHLSWLHSNAQKVFAEIQASIRSAERHLENAEEEFAESAFAPFWDEIEQATNKLAAYQHGIERIHRISVEYQSEADKMPARLRPYNLPVRELPDGRPAAGRLASIVRKAQKNFHFAMIYEQRKTNQILVDGFGTLALAIYEIGDTISSSLSNLSNSLHTPLDELLDVTREHSKKAESALKRHTEMLSEQAKQATEDAARRKQYEQKFVQGLEKQEEMLDNIQRRRKPSPWDS
jgi:hypothetical protein